MWLLELARQFMLDEGSGDAAHDYDHLVRVIALADKIQSAWWTNQGLLTLLCKQ